MWTELIPILALFYGLVLPSGLAWFLLTLCGRGDSMVASVLHDLVFVAVIRVGLPIAVTMTMIVITAAFMRIPWMASVRQRLCRPIEDCCE